MKRYDHDQYYIDFVNIPIDLMCIKCIVRFIIATATATVFVSGFTTHLQVVARPTIVLLQVSVKTKETRA